MCDPIGESAQGRLLASSYLALRFIGCSFHDGVLTLRGSLPSHHQKQLAQAIVADVEGVREVVNQIRVGPAAIEEAAGHDEGWRKAPGRRG
jgi:osmotically-inducible protein OsmY